MSKTSAYISPGIRYIILAGLFFTLMQVIIKEMTEFHLFQIIFFRSVITAVVATAYLRRRGIPLLGTHPKILATRAIFGITSMTLFFTTIQIIPLGAAVSLRYLSPLFTALLAVWLLGERIRAVQWILFGLAFLGVVLLKGFDVRIAPLALGLGIAGSICAALVYVIIRKIGTSEHPLVIMNYFMFSATVLGGLAMIPFWKTPSLLEFGALLLMGTLGYFAQLFMTKAHQIELASRVAPFRYLEVVYSLLLGYLFFEEAYAALSLLGIVLIVGSMMLNVVLKYRSKAAV